MAYADYAYYQEIFLGGAISEEDFPRLALRASEKVDLLTEFRARAYYEKKKEPIANAVCAVAEILQQLEHENALIGGGSSRNNTILTEITGKHHIQYAAPINTSSPEGQAVMHQAVADAAIPHLYPTGLLYRGW